MDCGPLPIVEPEGKTFTVGGPCRQSRRLAYATQPRSIDADHVQDALVRGSRIAWVLYFLLCLIDGERQALTVRRPNRRVQTDSFRIGDNLHPIRGHDDDLGLERVVEVVVGPDIGNSAPVGRPRWVTLEARIDGQPLPAGSIDVGDSQLIGCRIPVSLVRKGKLTACVDDSRPVGRDIHVVAEGMAMLVQQPLVLRVRVDDHSGLGAFGVHRSNLLANVEHQLCLVPGPMKETRMDSAKVEGAPTLPARVRVAPVRNVRWSPDPPWTSGRWIGRGESHEGGQRGGCGRGHSGGRRGRRGHRHTGRRRSGCGRRRTGWRRGRRGRLRTGVRSRLSRRRSAPCGPDRNGRQQHRDDGDSKRRNQHCRPLRPLVWRSPCAVMYTTQLRDRISPSPKVGRIFRRGCRALDALGWWGD